MRGDAGTEKGRSAAAGRLRRRRSGVWPELADGGFTATLDTFGAGDASEHLVRQAREASELGDGCASVELGRRRGFHLGEELLFKFAGALVPGEQASCLRGGRVVVGGHGLMFAQVRGFE